MARREPEDYPYLTTTKERFEYISSFVFKCSLTMLYEKIDISQAVIYSYVKEERMPSAKVIESMNKAGISIDWLLFHDGIPFNNNENGKRLREKYRIGTIDEENKSMKAFFHPFNTGYKGVTTGQPDSVWNLGDMFRFENATSLRVFGTSMAPFINEQDIVIVEEKAIPSKGDVIACFKDGELLVRRYEVDENDPFKALLVPENPKYPTIKIKPKDDFYTIGRCRIVLRQC